MIIDTNLVKILEKNVEGKKNPLKLQILTFFV